MIIRSISSTIDMSKIQFKNHNELLLIQCNINNVILCVQINWFWWKRADRSLKEYLMLKVALARNNNLPHTILDYVTLKHPEI